MRRTRTTSKAADKTGLAARVWIAVLLVLAAVFMGVVLVVNAKLQFIQSSPRIPLAKVTPEGTRVLFRLDPDCARDRILGRMVERAPWLERFGMAEWVLDRFLPWEAGLSFVPDASNERINVMAFVNEKRLAPVIIEAVAQADIPKNIPYVKWSKNTFEARGRGFLHMDGVVPVLPEARDIVRKRWGRASLTMPLLTLNNGHLVEAYFDNRDGGTCAVLVSVLVAMGADPVPLVAPDFIEVMATVSETHLYGDLTADNALALRLEIKINENTPEDYLEVFPDSFDLFMYQVLKVLGLEMEGSVRREGAGFVAEYTMADPASILHNQPGAPAPAENAAATQ